MDHGLQDGHEGVLELIDDLEAQLSQESCQADMAEACRSSSDDEIDVAEQMLPPPYTWWVNNISRHTTHLAAPPLSECNQPLKLISACTGACAEGNVLEVTSRTSLLFIHPFIHPSIHSFILFIICFIISFFYSFFLAFFLLFISFRHSFFHSVISLIHFCIAFHLI